MTAPLVRRFAANPTGRDLIVGDIHACFGKLRADLDAVGFDPAAGDRLFSVGDLVDRGPEPMEALRWLEQPWFFAVAGNHDDFAIRWPRGFMDPLNYARNGGYWNIANPPELQQAVATAFAALPVAIELETAAGLVGIVHADCPAPSWPAFVAALENPALSNAQRGSLIDAAQWSRDRAERLFREDVEGVRAVVVGHVTVTQVSSLGNVVFIDTGAWRDQGADPGRFALLDAATLLLARPR